MRTFPRRTFLLAILVVGLSLPLSGQTSGTAADEKDVRSIGAQLQEAWNKRDARMLADLWLTDGDYVSSTGRTATGRAEVEKAFDAQWSGLYKGTKLAHTLTSVRFLRKDVAIADGAFEISGMKDASGKLLPTRSGLSTVIAVRKGDRWYVAALRGMVPSVPEGAPGK
ncbi:MAG TPA: SgcJ/EcaC family oxidoreductase [Thermoanaerobaculia bacterium]|nr:SgcJ/EcaC family oxidoreductase [Thermoanaerobaculia bacterium]